MPQLNQDFRLLHVIAGAAQGGAESFFLRLVLALHGRSLQQQVVMRPFAQPMQKLQQHGITFYTAPFRRILDFSSQPIINRAIDQFQPTVVMSWMSRASDIMPVTSAIHVARLGGYYDLKYYKRADYLIGNTRAIVNYFHDHNWPHPYTGYLPNFPDIPTSTVSVQRRDYQTPDDAPLILALGRFHPDKAFDILIPALAKVPGAYLWLGGDGPEYANLAALADKYNVLARIRFLGWQPDVSSLYQACDIYTCPSRVEPLGNVILEAWAHRKPVVAAASAGPLGLINHQHNGLLVPMNDSDALANALNTVITDQKLRHDLVEQGFNTYEANFTQQSVTDAYIKFFSQIIQQGKR